MKNLKKDKEIVIYAISQIVGFIFMVCYEFTIAMINTQNGNYISAIRELIAVIVLIPITIGIIYMNVKLLREGIKEEE